MSGIFVSKIEEGAYRIFRIGPEWFMRLYALGVIQRNPANAGFELAPAEVYGGPLVKTTD